MKLPPKKVNARPNADASLVLVNLAGGDTFVFQYFPEAVELTGRANWKAQEVVTRTKPLFYGNREPQQLSFPSLWLDSSAGGGSLTPEIIQLLALQDVVKEIGTPPPLLARWGDSSFRCVLEEVQIVQKYFSAGGVPLRAEISLTLLELQEEPPAPVVRRNEEANILF
jgi:hypothetical protein